MQNKHYTYILFGLVYLGKPASATAQHEGVNYVRRVDILKAYESDCDEDLSNDEQLLHRKTWQFYDDLGRPSVLAESGKNFNGTYAVSMNEYDQTGRISKVWTPFDCGTVIEAENPWALQIKSGQYFNDTYGFTQIGYNTFDEPVAETGSGKAWHENSKMKTVRYVVNKANTVRRYEAPTNVVSLVDAGIAHISYDNLNHPREIQFTNGGIIRYVYAPDGTKLRTTYLTATENIVVPVNMTLPLQPAQIVSEDSIEYLGDEIYENGTLSKFLFTGGFASLEAEGPVFHYFSQDHLGNIRTVVNEQGTLEQVTHYYPFGAVFADAGSNQTLQPYKFNGKELDRMHGLDWYDYGARRYDPVLCTWTSYDSRACENVGVSPMAYCANNPVNAIDPDGNDWYRNADGFLLWQPDVNSHTKLPKGYTYVGQSHVDMKNGTFYRKDGSVLFTNETQAYNRMWTLARKMTRSHYYPCGKEESAFILKNGNVLVLPDNWNDSMTSKLIGYTLKDKILSNGKEKYQVVGHVHTHQDKSFDRGASNKDQNFAESNSGIPFYILHGNNNIYGIIYFGTEKWGWANDTYVEKVSNILNGNISLYSITKRLSLK